MKGEGREGGWEGYPHPNENSGHGLARNVYTKLSYR